MKSETIYRYLKDEGAISLIEGDQANEIFKEWYHYGLIEREGEQIRPTAYFQPLSYEKIMDYLPEKLRQRCAISVVFETESTNADLLNQRLDRLKHDYAIAVAERQSRGRGRRGKEWHSPLMVNLYFSFQFSLPIGKLASIEGLSLLVGAALADLLHSYGMEVKVKWPNDLWVGSAKLAGILIESQIDQQSINVVIGIGINNQAILYNAPLNNQITSIEALRGRPIDRNRLTADLSIHLATLVRAIQKDRDLLIGALQSQWRERSVLSGQKVTVWHGDRPIMEGVEVGIATNGALLICDDFGTVQAIERSDYSLRPSSL